MTHHVKSRRRYDSAKRRTDARARREAVLTAARHLFLDDGFAPTTVSAVASRAGVSEEMVYKNFGGKTGLVRALHDEALLGDGPVPAERRSDSLRESADAREVVRGWSILSMEVASRVSPIALLVRDAALVDPRMGGLLAELDDRRHRRMADNAQFLHSAGHLRPEVTEEEATDLMWSVTSPEMFELLVRRRGWSLERYAGFVYRTIAYGLLAIV
ncbi:TetR/AcrR family transcriptional regulator [Lapillicoccus sp.]|uniref:TetR/AcrR family transcriptional regulator n=1 Tax=Lapillicoccus sp. TaxID=1909287 RepID=UPI00398375C5